MKYGPAALDPKNPRHHHAMSLPGEFYMEGKPTPKPKLTSEQQSRLDAAREEFKRRKAAGLSILGKW